MLVGRRGTLVFVDEFRQIAELEFHAGAHDVLRHRVGASIDDRLAVLDAALVVVGQVKDEQIPEIKLFDRFGHWVLLSGSARYAVAKASGR